MAVFKFFFQAAFLIATAFLTRVSIAQAKSCPTWTIPTENNSQECVCGNSLGDRVRCDPLTHNVSLLKGYCMTYDNDTGKTYVASCPYKTKRKVYTTLPLNVVELNHFMCSSYHRKNLICSECFAGYGPSVFTNDLECFKCSGLYHGWPLYIFFELFPVTVFFFILTVFYIRMTASGANCILFCMQMLSAILGYNYGSSVGFYPFGKASEIIRRILLTVYGIWNLDFFRKIIPPFCVSENINGISAIALQYLAVLYLLGLTISIFVVLELQYHGFKPVMWLWKYVLTRFIQMRRYWILKYSLVDSLATFLLLSYTRLMLISFNLLYPNSIYDEHGSVVTISLSYQAGMKYFGKKHLPFAILAIATLFLLVLTPLLIFIVYPCVQRCGYKMRWSQFEIGLNSFLKLFQGCFKDGTNGTRDYRWFSIFYFVLRFLVFITHILCYSGTPHVPFLLPGLVLLISALTILILQPYKRSIYNSMDGVMLAFAAIICFLQTIMTLVPDTTFGKLLQIAIEIGMFTPIFGILLYLVYRSLKLCRAKLCHQKPESIEGDLLSDRMQDSETEEQDSFDFYVETQ